MRLTQLTLGLSLRDEATFANFYAGKNHQIMAGLKATASGVGERQVYLCGMRGLGRSHLLQACCHYAHQHQLSSGYFPLAQLLSYAPEFLSGLENLDLVCLDDLHLIAGHNKWEEAVFHLFNRILECESRLIVSAENLPKSLQLKLPDLESRLAGSIVYQLNPLSDDEKITILTLRAEQRGITFTEEVGRYILTHCSRHMIHLFAALDLLDNASLAAQRRITIPFVKEVLLQTVFENKQLANDDVSRS